MRRYRRETGRSMALSSFLLSAFAQALGRHRELQGHILRGKRVVVFDDIDVSTVVERKVADRVVPTSYVIRRAQARSAQEIEAEIFGARSLGDDALFGSSVGYQSDSDNSSRPRGQKAARLPRPLRRLALRIILRRNPFLKKRLFGTVSFSASHIFGQGYGYGIPVTPHPVHLLIGGIETREAQGRSHRQIACATLTLDHNIADGAPAIRFINDLKRAVAKGLPGGAASSQDRE